MLFLQANDMNRRCIRSCEVRHAATTAMAAMIAMTAMINVSLLPAITLLLSSTGTLPLPALRAQVM
jgi:hypothetical protein